MFKVMFVLHERPGMDRDKALDYWQTTHAQIAGRIPGVTSYVQHHAVAAPAGTPPFLGMASMVFPDQETFAAAAGGPEFAAAIADVANFADETNLPTGFMADVVVV